MRIMFRRQFDLFLASHGAEALDIVRDKDIDVIVADHRMPKMTGVEVLSKVRALSPRTVRILLTGYADLDAVEGSINESEVFRFLTKPCAPQQLRETIELAAKLAREAPAPPPPRAVDWRDPPATRSRSSWRATRSPRSARDRARPTPRRARRRARPSSSSRSSPRRNRRALEPRRSRARSSPPGLGIVVFSMDNEVVDAVQKAVRGRLPVYTAGNIVQVVKFLDRAAPRRPRHRRLRGQGHDPIDDGAAQGAPAAARDDRRLAAPRRARHGVADQSRADLPLPAQAAVGRPYARSACRRRCSIIACC